MVVSCRPLSVCQALEVMAAEDREKLQANPPPCVLEQAGPHGLIYIHT